MIQTCGGVLKILLNQDVYSVHQQSMESKDGEKATQLTHNQVAL